MKEIKTVKKERKERWTINHTKTIISFIMFVLCSVYIVWFVASLSHYTGMTLFEPESTPGLLDDILVSIMGLLIITSVVLTVGFLIFVTVYILEFLWNLSKDAGGLE